MPASSSTTPTDALAVTLRGSLGLAGAEISAFDAASRHLFVTASNGLQVVDLADPAAPLLLTTLDFTRLGFATTDITSVAAKGGIVAVALPNADKAQPGQVIFLDATSNAVLGAVTVGALPDMLTFTPDGTKVLVANEGEVVSDADFGGDGTVSIIDLSAGIAAATVQTAGFASFDGQEAALRAAGVRIWAGKSISEDVEPEYIAVSADGTTAMVTLQEANAVAILDIANASFTRIVPLGLKDFSSLLLDTSDRDGPTNGPATNLHTAPVLGLSMPDAIDSYSSGGQTYYVTANEGDDRDDFLAADETIRVGSASYDLDDATFPDEVALKANAALGRLTVSNAPGLRGDTDGDGDIDQILVYGGRSFSILDAQGAVVFDSGDLIERIIATEFPALFDDTRSDNKGPEPEGIEIARIDSRVYAFVGLERSHLSLVFDVTDPVDVSYTGAARREGDLNPEGGLFIAAAESPTGRALYVQTNEVSNTISIFDIVTAATPPAYRLQLLHLSDAEAGLLAAATAPNLAALVDAFDDDFANTLILSGGDNYIPGPFLAAGTDPSVGLVHDKGTNFAAADIEILNRIGVEASTVGNHEFDLGTAAFADAINDAAFPYLSANLDLSGDASLAARYQETVGVGGLELATAVARKVVPSAVVQKGGETIGLVGATTQVLESISSVGGVAVKGFAGNGTETNDMVLLAAQLQLVIDDLTAQGVNKIILMSHLQQIQFETALAPLLSGVDIILAAGSHTRLGDADDQAVDFPGHAADFDDTYPITVTAADGGTTLIVNTDNEFSYLGRLVVDFDAEGRIITGSLDPAINGAYAATAANVAAAWGVDAADLATTAFAEGTRGEQVGDITEAVQAVINAKDGEIWGYTGVYLEGERNQVRGQETNLGDLSADANAFVAGQALGLGAIVGSLKNGGGIRAQIGTVEPATGDKLPTAANPAAGKPAGAISTLDIENALRFDNKLMVFDTTPAGLKAILEFAAGIAPGNGGFMQIGGIRVAFDPAAPIGSRVQSIAMVNLAGDVVARVVEDGQVLADAPGTLPVVSLNFTANGGDGYPVKANATNFRYLLTDGSLSAAVDPALDLTAATTFATVGITAAQLLGEQQAFKDYLQAFHATPDAAYGTVDTPATADERIQNLAVKAADTVFAGSSLLAGPDGGALDGTAGNDTLAGGVAADTLAGGAGDDSLDGAAGGDVLLGGTGGDTILAGDGADWLVGQDGNDSIGGDAGDDYAFGSEGADSLGGGSGDDILLGEAGDDSLRGGDGADRLLGDAGADRLSGEDGQDSLFGGAGGDILDGGPGDDVVAGGEGDDSILGGGGSDWLDGEGGRDTIAVGDGDATIQGGSGDDSLSGGAGASVIVGGEGADSILGGTGAEYLVGEVGDDTILGGAGSDTILGGEGADSLDGGAGGDVIVGGAGDDILCGGQGADWMVGEAGNDTLVASADGDILSGGLGQDAFRFVATAGGPATIVGFAPGEDRLEFSAAGIGSGLAAGMATDGGLFIRGAAATEAFGQFVYDAPGGTLSWDADGTGAGAMVTLAILVGPPDISAADLSVIG